MPSGHFAIDLLENDFDGAAKIAETLGVKLIICPHIVADARPTDAAGWQAFGERLGKVGEKAKTAGFDFAWHNHDFEFKPLADGSLPQKHMLDAAPDIGWEMDVAWVIRGGADPLKWIADYGPRITAVHVKDIAPAGQNANEDGWADVGHGTVDWRGLVKAFKEKSAAKVYRDGARQSERRRSLRAALDRSGEQLLRGMTWQRNSASASSAAATSRPPISGLRRSSRASRCAPARTSTWTPPRRAPRSSACAPRRSTSCSTAKDIDIIVNLTIPAVHYDVSRQVLDAGKHVYSEKPFVLSRQGRARPQEARGEEEAAHRLGPGHLPRRRASAGAAPDRQRQARQDHQRHLLRDEPRHGALASQSRLLLPARRRAGARHRPLLCLRPDPADRPGEAGRRA